MCRVKVSPTRRALAGRAENSKLAQRLMIAMRVLPATLTKVMGDLTLFEREMYTEAAAARLLGVAQGTVHYWLEGGGKALAPTSR